MGNRVYGSWSRVPCGPPLRVLDLEAATRLAPHPAACGAAGSLLPVGAGRSYGDSGVNTGGGVVDLGSHDRILDLDAARGVVHCEAGATLARVLQHVVPHGWVVPACPGTARVTLGGAVAHDVHGKDHAHVGTFGSWVERLSLLRSDGARLACSPHENPELFEATIGGLGLTGIVTDVTLRLRPLSASEVEVERLRCSDLESALAHLRATDRYDYGYAWVDSFRPARFLVLRARLLPRAAGDAGPAPERARRPSLLGRCAPAWTFRRSTMRVFNRLYERGGARRLPDRHVARQSLERFLFPQDSVHPSNRLYGQRGVRGHHSLLPAAGDPRDEGLAELLAAVARRGAQSLVTVLKAFGPRRSPGVLSFTGEGTSVAVGFPNEGPRTLALLAELDRIVLARGGKLYPAKDARMPADAFRASFPGWAAFARQVDPAHSSNFWRRVSQPG